MIIHTRPSTNRVRFSALYIAAMMALIPLFNLQVMGVGFFLLMGGGLIMLMPFTYRNLKIKQTLFLYGLFAAYDLLTFAWAPGNPDMFQYIKMIAYFLLITTVAFNAVEVKTIMLFQCIMGVVVAGILCTTTTTMMAQGEYLTDTKRAVLQVGDELIDPNYAAMLMFPAFIYATKMLLSGKKLYERAIHAVILVICLYALLRSGTRGGLLAIIAGALFYFFSGKQGMSKRIGIAIFVLIGGAILFPYIFELLPETVQRRFSIEALLRNGGSGRSDIWKACIAGVGDSLMTLLFGHGKGATMTALGVASHNFLLDQLYNGGILALVLLSMFIGTLFAKAGRNGNVYAKSLLVAYFAMMMTVSVGANMYFWTGMAFVVLLSNWNEETLNRSLWNGEW